MLWRACLKSPKLAGAGFALVTLGALVCALAMSRPRATPFEQFICGLHPATAPGLHCGWCYGAAVTIALGCALLAAARQARRPIAA